MSRMSVQLSVFTFILATCAGCVGMHEVTLRGQDPTIANSTPSEDVVYWSLSLREAIAMALDHHEVLRTLKGISPVTGLDPAISSTRISEEEGAFNPELKVDFDASRINEPPESFFGPGLSAQTRRDVGNFSAELAKKWSQGLSTRIGYDPSTAYLFFPNSAPNGTFNPSHQAGFFFEVSQPLLKGFGHSTNLAPIRIATVQTEQERYDLQAVILEQIRGTEQTYWKLHSAIAAWMAVQSVVPIAEESVRVSELRYNAERTTYSDVARGKVQLERVRRQLVEARFDIWQAENEMRQLLGVQATDPRAIIPTDIPAKVELHVDIGNAIATALDNRPDLQRRRLELKRLSIENTVAHNDLLPQFDAKFLYRSNGLNNRLDNALYQAADFNYTDWTVGVEFSIPIGNRSAKSRVNQKELELARERARVREYEKQVGYDLALIIAELKTGYQLFERSQRQVKETHEWLRLATLRYANPTGADASRNSLLAALDDMQTALQQHIDAQISAAESLAAYNGTIAKLKEAQGISLQQWNVELVGGSETAPPVSRAYNSYRTNRVGHSLSNPNLSSPPEFGP